MPSKMNQKDTPPASPEMEEDFDEDDLIYVGDVDEILDAMDGADHNEDDEGNEDDDDDNEMMMEEDELPVVDNSCCVFKQHKGSVFCGSLSKDGKLAATGGEDDKAYVWDTLTAQVVLTCKGHKDSVIFAGFNHNDAYLATGDMSGIIKVWRTSDWVVVWDFEMGDASWMRWHGAANVLFAGSVEGDVYMWRIPDGECKLLQGFGQRTDTAVIFPDGKRIAIGYEDGTTRVMDLKTASVVASSVSGNGHTSTITDIDCQPDSKLIISTAVDGKTILRSPQTGNVVTVLQDLQERKSSIDDDEDGASGTTSDWPEVVAFCNDTELRLAATGTVNGEIFIWDIVKKVLRHKISQGSGVSKLAWKGKTPLLFSGALDGIVRCYDARTAECIKSFKGHTEDILDMCISHDGTRLLTTSDDSVARIFDITNFSSSVDPTDRQATNNLESTDQSRC